MSNIAFQPFPDKCPIPPNMVAHIGGVDGPAATFVLLCNGMEIIVKTPANPFGSLQLDYSVTNEPSEVDALIDQHYDKIVNHYLGIIAPLMATIEWGKTNWAYLIPPMRNSGYRIVQRQERILPTTCPVWGRLIPISEVEFTVFGFARDRRGIWRGKKCDIYVAWNDSTIESLDRAMYAWRLTEGMDLTFQFYGHLVDNEGNIIGIVSEAGWGRPITLDDRNKIYAAAAKLQRRGLVYRSCLMNRFLITNGKVRLTEMESLFWFASEDVDTMAETWHWEYLSELFWDIEHEGKPFGRWGSPSGRFITSSAYLKCMPLPPSPESPLGNALPCQNFFKILGGQVWSEYRKQGKGSVVRKRLLTADKIEDEADDSENAIISIDSRDYEDRPLSVTVLYAKHQRRVQHHPYSGRPRIRGSRAITFSDTSAGDSEVSYSGGKNRSSWIPQ